MVKGQMKPRAEDKSTSVGSGTYRGKMVRKLNTGVEGTQAVLDGTTRGAAISAD